MKRTTASLALIAAVGGVLGMAVPATADDANGQYTVTGPEASSRGKAVTEAHCKPGDLVVGGSYEVTDGVGSSSLFVSTGPTADATGWYAHAQGNRTKAKPIVLCQKAAG
ncbi:hypothetical protein ABT160_25585 [Streptomyces sp. NPDC001941]|uniref:hypothetical protein n=1 Tax=Streptomyces sp. NPDC001941 TaxID=3154659 RepID=UPI003327DDC1